MTDHTLPTEDTKYIRLVNELPYSDNAYDIAPDMADILSSDIKRISPDALVFHNKVTDFAGIMFIWILGLSFFCIVSLIFAAHFIIEKNAIAVFSMLMMSGFLFVILKLFFLPILSDKGGQSLTFSRSLQKVIYYCVETDTVKIKDYRDMIPTIRHTMMASVGGVSQWYFMLYTWVDNLTDRRVTEAAGTSHMHPTPEVCLSRWHLIRTYMEGKPEDMPAITDYPKESHIHKESQMYMFADYDYQRSGAITEGHRIKNKLMSPFIWMSQCLFASSHLGRGYIATRLVDPMQDPKVQALLKEAERSTDTYKTKPADPMILKSLQGKNHGLVWRWRSYIITHVVVMAWCVYGLIVM